MVLRRVSTLIAGLLVAAVSVTGVAAVNAQEPAPSPEAQAGGPAGAERARAAGIYVEPAAAERMAAAPKGTCANDPTLPKCPAAHSFVTPPTQVSADGATVTSSVEGSSQEGSGSTEGAAQEMQMGGAHCSHHADDPEYYFGVMLGSGSANCTGTSRMELYVSLARENYRGNPGFTTLDTEADFQASGFAGATAQYNCHHSATRSYRTRAELYWLHNGTWYAPGPSNNFRDRTCPA